MVLDGQLEQGLVDAEAAVRGDARNRLTDERVWLLMGATAEAEASTGKGVGMQQAQAEEEGSSVWLGIECQGPYGLSIRILQQRAGVNCCMPRKWEGAKIVFSFMHQSP